MLDLKEPLVANGVDSTALQKANFSGAEGFLMLVDQLAEDRAIAKKSFFVLDSSDGLLEMKPTLVV